MIHSNVVTTGCCMVDYEPGLATAVMSAFGVCTSTVRSMVSFKLLLLPRLPICLKLPVFWKQESSIGNTTWSELVRGCTGGATSLSVTLKITRIRATIAGCKIHRHLSDEGFASLPQAGQQFSQHSRSASSHNDTFTVTHPRNRLEMHCCRDTETHASCTPACDTICKTLAWAHHKAATSRH